MKIFRKQPQTHFSIAAKTADSITYASKGAILKKNRFNPAQQNDIPAHKIENPFKYNGKTN